MARSFYAGLIEVPEGKGVCVRCGQITPKAEIICAGCARVLEAPLMDTSIRL